MFVIVVYDIGNKKSLKLHKYLKQKLNWIQNSVFEWELSESDYIRMKWEIKQLLKRLSEGSSENNNSVIVFDMPYRGALKRTVIWKEKNPIDNFI